MASIGGGPFFTSLEGQTLDVIEGDSSQSVLLSLEYKLNAYLTLGAATGKFIASNKADYNKEEINFYQFQLERNGNCGVKVRSN